MKKKMESNFLQLTQKILITFAFVLASLDLSAASLALMLRGDQSNLAEICKSCVKLEVVQSDAKEFANGNTFVLLKQSVAQQNVVIFAPATITADQMMELLIKIKTVKAGFAKSVSVSIYPKNSKLQVLDGKGSFLMDPKLVEKLVSIAGADNFNGSRLTVDSKQKSGTKMRSSQTKSVVVDLGTNSKLAQSVATNLDLPVLSADQMDRAITHSNHAIVVSSVATPHNESFLKMLAAADGLTRSNVQVTMVTPYLPYARSDKVDQSGVAIVGRLAADMIEASGVSNVQFVRAHAPQSEGFFRIPTIQSMGRLTINRHLKTAGIQQVISPDAGFQKDATLYADELGVPVAVINKQRDLQTGEAKIVGVSGPDVVGKVVAIIDDETASGKTLHLAAKFLKENGASKVVAVVTHLAGDASHAINSPFIDEMVVTDTFDVKVMNPKLKILSLANEISQDLRKMLQPAPRCQSAYN